MIRHSPKLTWGRKGLFRITAGVYHEDMKGVGGTQSKDLEVGTEAEAMEESCLLSFFSACFLIPFRNTCP